MEWGCRLDDGAFPILQTMFTEGSKLSDSGESAVEGLRAVPSALNENLEQVSIYCIV